MAASDLSTHAGICKVITVVLGFVILVLGCVSHFQSTWAKKYCEEFGENKYCIKYSIVICELAAYQNKSCPENDMERYYVAMIIICFFFSLAGLAATFVHDSTNSSFKQWDAGYHLISSILLFIAAIVYFVSTEQIYKIVEDNKGEGFNFMRPEKLASASLTVTQSILYGATSLFIFRS